MKVKLWLWTFCLLVGTFSCTDRRTSSPSAIEGKSDASRAVHLGQKSEPPSVDLDSVAEPQLLIFTALPVVDDSEQTLKSEDIVDVKDKLAILSSNISIGIDDNTCEPILEAGTLIPVRRTNVFSTSVDGQREITLHLWRGRSELTKDNRSIGEIRIVGLSRAEARSPRIHVQFEIRRNGDLAVSALDQDSEKSLGVVYSKQNLANEQTGDSPSTEIMAAESAGESKELLPSMRFHWCPPGDFVMNLGSTNGQPTVGIVIVDGFWLAETETTQQMFQSMMDVAPWHGEDGVVEGDKIAASHITSFAAVEFCEKLTRRELAVGHLPSGWRYALPTASQWEYACRTGKATTFAFGENDAKLGEYAWLQKNTSEIGEPYAHQVGLKKSNAWGLCDMHGNVGELCAGWFAPGGRQVYPLEFREVRGGSWLVPSSSCGCGNVQGVSPNSGSADIGFRVAAVRSAQ